MEEQVKTKNKGKRNRAAGHAFEVECMKRMREAGFPHTATCRSESRNRDNLKVDLINLDEVINGRLPYNIQCKNKLGRVDYITELRVMPQGTSAINVVLHNATKTAGSRFHTVGQYAILSMDDFLGMVKRIQELEKSLQDQKATLNLMMKR